VQIKKQSRIFGEIVKKCMELWMILKLKKDTPQKLLQGFITKGNGEILYENMGVEKYPVLIHQFGMYSNCRSTVRKKGDGYYKFKEILP